MKRLAIFAFLIIIPIMAAALDENSPELIKLRESYQAVVVNRMFNEWNKEHVVTFYGDVNKTWTNAIHLSIDDRILYFQDNGKNYIISGVWVIKEK